MIKLNREKWIIYGAYGYTGELIVKEAIKQGRKPVLGGRTEASLKLLSEKYELPIRVFSTEFWGRVSTDDGRECSGTISGPSVYDLTAETAVAIALNTEHDTNDGGYFTASMLVGADFLSDRDGYQVEIFQATAGVEHT